MPKQIYINLPVADLATSVAFYEKLGFKQNQMFVDDTGSAVQWSDDIVVMLLRPEFYKKFIRDKQVIDPKTTSGAVLALSFDTAAEAKQFAETAKASGGDYFQVDIGVPEDQMVGYEVLDPDGHQWEAMWMAPTNDTVPVVK